VAKEIAQGLVTIAGARNYGVVVASDGAVDTAATEALRAEMRRDRGEPELFDFGPGIDDLRARCETETGLPAPVQPVWHHAQAAE
jgi:N-methylhydantoinase B